MRILPARFLLFALVVLVMSSASFAQIGVGIAIHIGPPALPVYVQPPCPAEGYIWTPGYWAYDYDYNDYYWVPGTWVLAPQVGFLWTPGWWGWGGDRFLFHEGYWGPRVGFYGGINYGFGYFGHGYEGGRWDHDHFFYNRSVNNVNITNIHNVYNTTVINKTVVNRVSYNGGNGGINERPRPEEEAAERERHIGPVAAQNEHLQAARSNPQLRASMNHGKPPIAATPRPGAFNEHGVVPAKKAGAPYSAANRGEAARPGNVPGERPANYVPRPGAQSTSATFRSGNVRLLPTPEIRSAIRNISNSKRSCMRSRIRNGRNFNRSKTRTTKSWRGKTPTRQEISRSNKSTSNRHSIWSKNTFSSNSTFSKRCSRQGVTIRESTDLQNG